MHYSIIQNKKYSQSQIMWLKGLRLEASILILHLSNMFQLNMNLPNILIESNKW